jgi:subtilisin family serine protease
MTKDRGRDSFCAVLVLFVLFYGPALPAVVSGAGAGIAFFASSGNSGYCNMIAFPACIWSIISAGAVFDANLGGLGFCVDPTSCAQNKQTYAACTPQDVAWAYTTSADQEAPYSNTASFLSLLAPSHNAYTTAMGGGYTPTFGGTSAASPHAAGAAAVLRSAATALPGSPLSLPTWARSSQAREITLPM